MKKTLSFLITGMLAAPLFSAAPLAMGAGTTVSSGSTTTIETDENFLGTFIDDGNLADGNAAVFDAQAFRNHPCYNAVGAEMDYCLSTLGVTSDFQSMIAGSEFNRLFLEYALDRRCTGMRGDDRTACEEENARALPALLGQLDDNGTGSVLSADDEDVTPVNDDNDDMEDTAQDTTMTRYQRSQRLWDMCEGHSETQAGCYQTFIRFVTDQTLSTADMEAVIRPGSRTTTGNDNDDDRDNNDTDDRDEDMNDDVRSETDEDLGSMNNRERAEWLWDLCADSGEGQSMCYRHHYRTAINTDTDLQALQEDIRG